MEKTKKMSRTFSTAFKKEKVNLIEENKITVLELSKIYEVSQTSIYRWLQKYGKNYSKAERVVVEKISEETKTLQLMKQIAELERVIGKQQLQLIYKEAVIQSAGELLGEDIEKKYDSRQSKKD